MFELLKLPGEKRAGSTPVEIPRHHRPGSPRGSARPYRRRTHPPPFVVPTLVPDCSAVTFQPSELKEHHAPFGFKADMDPLGNVDKLGAIGGNQLTCPQCPETHVLALSSCAASRREAECGARGPKGSVAREQSGLAALCRRLPCLAGKLIELIIQLTEIYSSFAQLPCRLTPERDLNLEPVLN